MLHDDSQTSVSHDADETWRDMSDLAISLGVRGPAWLNSRLGESTQDPPASPGSLGSMKNETSLCHN
jgi:hypothetical protein